MYKIKFELSDYDESNKRNVISSEVVFASTFEKAKANVKLWLANTDYEIQDLVNIIEEPDCCIPKLSGTAKKGYDNYILTIEVTETE